MRRSKAAVSVEVKQVIGALCKLLAATGLEDVPPPETFRRAKFGGGLEVEEQFWQLLANILQTTGIVSCEDNAPLRELRKLVAAGLWQTGYYADWMFDRGRGGGGGDAVRWFSRDLLLALGWLLASGTLEKLLTQRVLQLDKTLPTTTCVNLQLSDELQLDAASLRRLQWLIGCLRNQGRILLSIQEEWARLLHAVLVALLPSSESSSDQSSTVLQEDCKCMRQLCDLLEAYLTWKQEEKVFWTWMDSVMDCHQADHVVKKPTHTPNRSRILCHHGNRGLEKLEEMMLRLPKGQKEWGRGREDAEDRGRKVRAEGGPHIPSLHPLHPPPPSVPTFPAVYRARLQTERPVRHRRHSTEEPRDGAAAPDELPSSQAVQVLLQTEALLLERRDRQRLANRTQLQDMIGRLDGLVLIPP